MITRNAERKFGLCSEIALDEIWVRCYTACLWSIFRRSSAVEQLTVNQLVVGSIPTAGATKSQKSA